MVNQNNKMLTLFHRNNSIACLRAKAQEHQAKFLNSGLLLQVRSLAGLQSPSKLSPQSCDSNANNLSVHHSSPPPSHHTDPYHNESKHSIDHSPHSRNNTAETTRGSPNITF